MFLAKRKSNFELEREFKFRLNALKVSDNYFRVNLWQLRRGECLFESERERERASISEELLGFEFFGDTAFKSKLNFVPNDESKR